jgi:hypothetical protein
MPSQSIRLCDRVIFHVPPQQSTAGQLELAALVTRVREEGLVDLIVFPAGGEAFHRDRIAPHGGDNPYPAWSPAAPEGARPQAPPAEPCGLSEARTAPRRGRA